MPKSLPIPSFYDSKKVEEIYNVLYQQRSEEALIWAKKHDIKSAATDRTRVCLMIIDAQNTFCLPNGELYVGGRSGRGAIEDNDRLCQFIYRNMGVITEIAPTMDTHFAMQIFHSCFWINDKGENPAPNTIITEDDVNKGVWKINPSMVSLSGGNYAYLQQHAMHYTQTLAAGGKYPLIIWPYHAMLGGVGHALVSAVHEAIFFHSIARSSQTSFQIKGGNCLTENYSVLAPEVTTGPKGSSIGAQRNTNFIKKLMEFDMVIIGGQAKSHCVAWTIDDLLNDILSQEPAFAKKVYLAEDLTSPVVIPGVIDFTQQGNDAFRKFEKAGMHVVRSTDDVANWPDSPLK